ncbi:uncharacterized protein LOC132278584 [Cornus florida]|uniref:uncharacterized protein LOC132278584 n=1 Tax=Cornus florida TaxID=4283 RepID=UPI00289C7130|nr:uncharacterized protein LOC132278584 [Cornus florida]
MKKKIDELLLQYRKQVRGNKGFDVDEYPLLSSSVPVIIIPISKLQESKRLLKLVKKLSKLAIQQYNRDHACKANYDLVMAHKANCQLAVGFIYYITFEVKDVDDGESKIFQAEVFDRIEKIDVVL